MNFHYMSHMLNFQLQKQTKPAKFRSRLYQQLLTRAKKHSKALNHVSIVQTSNAAKIRKKMHFRQPRSCARASAHSRMSKNPLQMRILEEEWVRNTHFFMFPIHKYGSAHRDKKQTLHLVELFPEPKTKFKNSSISHFYDRNKHFLIWKLIKFFAFFPRLVLSCIDEFFDSLFTSS